VLDEAALLADVAEDDATTAAMTVDAMTDEMGFPIFNDGEEALPTFDFPSFGDFGEKEGGREGGGEGGGNRPISESLRSATEAAEAAMAAARGAVQGQGEKDEL
jgi:hypothetical protein